MLLSIAYTVSNTNNSGLGSLRQAILNANANPGRDEIIFNLPGSGVRTIRPTSALPAVTDPVAIDATTQPGYDDAPLVEINGTSAGANVSGLRVNAHNTLVKGLAINGFAGGAGVNVGSVHGARIMGNHLGTNAAGAAAVPNRNGVVFACNVTNPCYDHWVGGPGPYQDNVISGNSQDGILITGASPPGYSGITIQNNLIGTTADGVRALGNGRNGITVSGPVEGVYVGGLYANEGNTISANGSHGVQLTRGTALRGPTNFLMEGNKVGYNQHFTDALGNHLDGVNIVGPTQQVWVANNYIVFSGRSGVRVEAGRAAILGNYMQGNTGQGIQHVAGGNNNQQAPRITSAVWDGAAVTLTGTVWSTPETMVTVEVFANFDCHSSGFGEGQLLAALVEVVTDGGGEASFTTTYATGSPFWFVAATATPLVNLQIPGGGYMQFPSDTSKFSACRRAEGAPGTAPGAPDGELAAALAVDDETPPSLVVSAGEPRLPAARAAADAVPVLAASPAEATARRLSPGRRADLVFAGLSAELPAEWLAPALR